MIYSRVNLSEYIVTSIWWGCNNNCTICMLSGFKDKLPPIGFENFKRLLKDIISRGRFRNLILSGAEVTTFDKLDKYVQFAASLEWFDRIQIQTNGRKLKDKAYVKHLVESGVNEFFVSIYGIEQIHDKITGVMGSFEEVMQGIQNLSCFDVNTITNTVLTRLNLHNAKDLFSLLSGEKVSEMHAWNLFPMDNIDNVDIILDLKDFARLLPEFLAAIRTSGKPLVFKGFPECLSIGEPGFFDNFFPITVLPDAFWDKFSECGFGKCFYRDKNQCASDSCWGLSTAYINRYGDERELLRPVTAKN
ncbi:MAG: radical SAM protein [Deltaproteobacteria bacterium]|nr:radical SAM protein [Deltaproteobacteria bacterium]